MGNRLTKIFTRKGDDGSTDTGSNERVPKYDIQIEVFGSLDELNASIGILTTEKNSQLRLMLFSVKSNKTYSTYLEKLLHQSSVTLMQSMFLHLNF